MRSLASCGGLLLAGGRSGGRHVVKSLSDWALPSAGAPETSAQRVGVLAKSRTTARLQGTSQTKRGVHVLQVRDQFQGEPTRAATRPTTTIIGTHRVGTSEHTATRRFKSDQQQQQQRYVGQPKRRSVIASSSPSELPERFRMEWPKITLFGDSITRRSFDAQNGCWGSMLAYRVNSYFDVDPRGFEGYNSRWARELMPKLFPKSYLDKVQLFVIFFGHNDSWDRAPLHVPHAEYEANMRAIVKYLLDVGQLERNKIILITPSWFHAQEFAKFSQSIGVPPLSKQLVDCEKYAEIVKQIARDEQLEAVDFFAASSAHEPLNELFCDGVHFSRKGAELLHEHLMPVVERKLELAYGKPLGDLWHAIPYDQHPELVPVLAEYRRKLSEAQESGKLP